MKGMKIGKNLEMHVVAQRRKSKWDRCTCKLVLHRSSALVEAAAELTQHPSSPIPRPMLARSLTHCISSADWGIPTSTDWGSLELQWDSSLCVHKFTLRPSFSLDPSAWTPALSPRVRSCGFAGQSLIMDQEGAGDDQGNWVTGRFSWLMPVCTWRNGVHHQHGCVWWAAYCLREEL